MPTLTFYVTDDVAVQLEKVIQKRTEKLGFVVSRGDIIVPHIKKEFKKEFPNGAHWIGKEKPLAVGGQPSAEGGKS